MFVYTTDESGCVQEIPLEQIERPRAGFFSWLSPADKGLCALASARTETEGERRRRFLEERRAASRPRTA